MEKVPTRPKYTVEPAKPADAEPIRQVQQEVWLQTYPNPDLKISEEWVKSQFKMDKRRLEFHRVSIRDALKKGSDVMYLVVKNYAGIVRGFLRVSRHGKYSRFDAIYVAKELQGTGIAHDMMKSALKFAGDLPMAVNVATYNQRAIRFYERYGFVKVAGSEHLHRGKIPVMDMKRPSSKERNEV